MITSIFPAKLAIVWTVTVLAAGLEVGFFSLLALTDAFAGQLIIALIAAIPPTGATIVALIALMRSQKVMRHEQKEMRGELDGKLTELMEAKEGAAKAAGKEEERTEERDRVTAIAADAAPSPSLQRRLTGWK